MNRYSNWKKNCSQDTREKVLCFEKDNAVADFYKKLQGIATELEGNISVEKNRIYYTITQLQYSVNTIIYACRTQNYDKVVRNFTTMTDLLMQVLNELFENIAYYNQEMEIVNPESVSSALEDILTAQDNRDYILVADLLEIKLIPFLQSVQEVIRTYDASGTDPAVWENNVKALEECNQPLLHKLMDYHKQYELENANGTWKGKHHLEDTNSGAFTMAGEDEKGVYYYHSNVDPLAEAVTFARYYYDITCDHYIIWGLGLGYHAMELLMLDDGIRLKIFESDMDVIYHCMMTTDLSVQLRAGSISLEYDADFSRVIQVLDENTKAFIIHHPSLRHIKDSRIRKQMEMFFISDSGKRNSAILFENNSRENFKHYDGYVDELRSDFEGKNVVIVAAGPSLDRNVEQLKRKPDNVLVIATGTVFRKLLQMGIKVDYVIVTDANARVYSQISGLEGQKIPMLYLSTSYKGFSMNYSGKKYLVCQNGYDKAEMLAEKNGWNLYETGGSVSTVALDVCIRLGCKSIAFIGLDLAYTDNLAHAEGTSRRIADGAEEMEKVPAIYGGTVPVSKLFMIYNRWIAGRVKQTDVSMPVYDATEGGAVIPGLTVTTLAKYLDTENGV